MARLLTSLTEYEVQAKKTGYNLADGHACQEILPPLNKVVDSLTEIWKDCDMKSLPESESHFRGAFSALASSSTMASLPDFKICLTSSQSIDIVGALLGEKKVITHLVEPTFDNLALLLQRRGVRLQSLDEADLFDASDEGDLPAFLDRHLGGALFLVQPNNPTGRILDAKIFQFITNYCATHNKILIIDNSFRFYNRQPYDDYSILSQSGTSFIAFEDTGKVWPTHELKASLLFCSPDLQPMITAIHNEFQISHSPFSLRVLEQFILLTKSVGLSEYLWRLVDQRRVILREVINDIGLKVESVSVKSQIPVEWLNIESTGHSDIEVWNYLRTRSIQILPGRQFFWKTSMLPERQKNIRLAFLKPATSFRSAMDILRTLQFKTKGSI